MPLIKSIPSTAIEVLSPGVKAMGDGGFDLIRGLQLANDLITNVLKLRDTTRGAAPAQANGQAAQANSQAAAPAEIPGGIPAAQGTKGRADKLLDIIEAALVEKVKTGHGDENALDTFLATAPKNAELLALLGMVK